MNPGGPKIYYPLEIASKLCIGPLFCQNIFFFNNVPSDVDLHYSDWKLHFSSREVILRVA